MDITKSYNISTDELTVSATDVYRTLGYSESKTPGQVIDKVASLLPAVMSRVSPRGGYYSFSDQRVTVGSNSLEIGAIIFNTGSIIASQLVGAEYMIAIIATAGSEITEISRKFINNGELLDGYIADAIGSLVAESVADYVEKRIEEQVTGNGLRLSNLLSPGYCGWDVSEQHRLFAMLPENFCGVGLNESALMTPIKSISAVVGVGKNVLKGPYPCALCFVDNCSMRK